MVRAIAKRKIRGIRVPRDPRDPRPDERNVIYVVERNSIRVICVPSSERDPRDPRPVERNVIRVIRVPSSET